MSPVDSDTVRLQRALSTLREMSARIEELEQEKNEPIAIIGMGCCDIRAPSHSISPWYSQSQSSRWSVARIRY